MALLKFGNPVILHELTTTPRDIFEFLFQPWPLRWGYVLGLGVFGLAIPRFRFEKADWRVLGWPAAWFVWQLVAATHTVSGRLTSVTLVHFLSCILCFGVGYTAFERMRDRRAFWTALLVAFLLTLWNGFSQHYGGLQAVRDLIYQTPNWQEMPPEFLRKIASDRIFSTLVYPNAFAGVILLVFPPSFVLLEARSRAWPNIARLLTLGLFLYLAAACFFWTGSKAGWLIATAVLAGFLLQLRAPKRWRILVAGLVVAAGLGVFAWKFAAYFQRGAPSASARFQYWRAALVTARDHPILGTGPGTFSIPYAQIKPPEAEMARLVHNDYLEQASDSGIAGAVLYCGWISLCLLRLCRKLSLTPTPEQIAAGFGLVAWLLQGFVEFGLYIPALSWTGFLLLGWAATPSPPPRNASTTPPPTATFPAA